MNSLVIVGLCIAACIGGSLSSGYGGGHDNFKIVSFKTHMKSENASCVEQS